MSDRAYTEAQVQQKTLIGSSSKNSLLQRTCACGQHTLAGGECEECRKKREGTLQRSQRAFGLPSAPGAVAGSSPALEHGPSFTSAFDRASRFEHDFSWIPIHSPAAGAIQTKLAINEPGDEYEQEADRISQQVMCMPEPQLQRACAFGGTPGPDGDGSACKAKRLGLQRVALTPSEASPSPKLGEGSQVPPIVHEVLHSPGQPLDAATRAFMEPRFGCDFSRVPTHAHASVPISTHLAIGAPHDEFEQEAEMVAQHVMSRSATSTSTGYDFSGVRIHTDGKAAESVRAVNALAYTVGRDIVFDAGQYRPQTHEGSRLIAHELAHVVQQHSGAAPMIARQSLREKMSVIWNVGLIPGYRAKELAAEALEAAQQTGLPGLHNGPADAWRHCYWNCRMTNVIGKDDAAFIAKNHEEQAENNPTAERMMDTWNNQEGQDCSGNCDSCCQKKLDAGKLWTLEDLGKGVWGGGVQKSKPTPRVRTPSVEKYEKY